MTNKEKAIHILPSFVIFIILLILFYHWSDVKLSSSESFDRNTFTFKDSSMIMNRHMGLINHDLFKKMVNSKLANEGCTYTIRGDSVFYRLKTKNTQYFFSQDKEQTEWIRHYKNLPIRIMPDGFGAKLQKIDSVEYILLPYQILVNLAK